MTMKSKNTNINSNTTNPTPFWREVTDEDVRKAISGSFLDTICSAYAKNYTPVAPFPLILMQGIALMAVALTHRKEKSENPGFEVADLFGPLEEPKDDFSLFPAHQSQLYIDTGAGNVPNAYVLVVAPSGAGKGMGNLQLVRRLGYIDYSGGTLEGIKEAAVSNPHLLITLPEFSSLLDARGSMAKFKGELTNMFNAGNISDALATKGQKRTASWFYPSVYASIQPEMLRQLGRGLDVSQGFLGRFLIGYVHDDVQYEYKPCNNTYEADLCAIRDGLVAISRQKGVVKVPNPDYNTDFIAPIRPVIGDSMIPVLRRYANEYLPRIALMLAIPAIGENMPELSELSELTSEHFERATVVMHRILTMAEEALGALTNLEGRSRFQEENLGKMLKLLIRMSKGAEPITVAAISKRSSGTGWDTKTREALINELQKRGYIKITCNGAEREELERGCVIEPKKENVPPGVL